MAKTAQAKRIKKRLVELDLTIASLGRKLSPIRPRTTVSQAIHHGRFPLVRKQIEEVLWP